MFFGAELRIRLTCSKERQCHGCDIWSFKCWEPVRHIEESRMSCQSAFLLLDLGVSNTLAWRQGVDLWSGNRCISHSALGVPPQHSAKHNPRKCSARCEGFCLGRSLFLLSKGLLWPLGKSIAGQGFPEPRRKVPSGKGSLRTPKPQTVKKHC